MPAHKVIVNDQILDFDQVPASIRGLQHIIGKSTPNDRKFVMKVDPTLVREKIQGKETENLGRSPIMIYDFGDMSKRAKQFDTWIINGIFFAIGVVVAASLYFWRVIEIFAK
jgi:hypothetical protein